MTQNSKLKKDVFPNRKVFQGQFRGTWDSNEICCLPDVNEHCICKSLSESAAKKVLEDHKIFSSGILAENMNIRNSRLITSPKNKTKSYFNKVPGHPELLKNVCSSFSYKDENNGSKIVRFERLLCSSLTITELCQLSWSGIPAGIRAVVWRLLSGYVPIQKEKRQYVLSKKRQDYLKMVKAFYQVDNNELTHSTYHQIHIDVPRMNPSIPLFQQNVVQKMFERILFIWAIKHPAVGYVQGINDLVTPFFIVFFEETILPNECFESFSIENLTQEQRDKIEADTFWCASKFLERIQDNYITAQPGIQQKVIQLQKLIQRVDLTLHRHLVEHNVDYLQFSFRWLNNLLTRELPLRCIIRLWDTYLAENETFALFQLYVCAAFLLYWRERLLLENDFQGLMLLLQNLPTHSWTNTHIALLVAEAYRLKVMFADSPSHLQYR